ncbi:MAG: DUF1707 domain-containing protein [Gemmatimonadota bacterium]
MAESGSLEPLPLEERKESAVRRLGAHFAEDHLTVEEFESRVDLVYGAASAAELETLFAGLPALRSAALPERAEAALPARARPEDVRGHGLVIAVMGGSERKGSWTPPHRLLTLALMGGAGLDLREARFGPGLTEITIIAVMGGVEVIVPPGLAVETHGFAFMGGFEGYDQPSVDPDPEAPRVRIRGVALMGGVEVAVRLPGESPRDAKRRRRAERQAGGPGRGRGTGEGGSEEG